MLERLCAVMPRPDFITEQFFSDLVTTVCVSMAHSDAVKVLQLAQQSQLPLPAASYVAVLQGLVAQPVSVLLLAVLRCHVPSSCALLRAIASCQRAFCCVSCVFVTYEVALVWSRVRPFCTLAGRLRECDGDGGCAGLDV